MWLPPAQEWEDKWLVKFNQKKCFTLHATDKTKLINTSYTIHWHWLEPASDYTPQSKRKLPVKPQLIKHCRTQLNILEYTQTVGCLRTIMWMLSPTKPTAHCGFWTEILLTVLGMSSSRPTATRHRLEHSWNMLPLCRVYTLKQTVTSWRWSTKTQSDMSSKTSADTTALLS